MQQPLRKFRGQYLGAGLPRIDWSHPLTLGLKVATVAGAGVQLNLVNGTLFPSVSSTPGVNTDGSVRTFSGAGDTLASSPMGTNGGAFSVVARIRPRNTVTNTAFAIYDCGSPGANGFDFFFSQAVIGGYLALTVWGVSAFGNDASAGAIWSDSTGSPITVGVTYAKNNATGLRYFRNGSLSLVVSTSGFGYNNINGTEYIGRREGANEPFYGDMSFVWGWTRALSDAEMAQIAADPGCFLIYPEDDIFALLVGATAAGGVIITSDGAMPVALAALLRRDASGSISTVTALREDAASPVSTGASILRDGQIPAEWLATLQEDGRAPAAFVETLNRDAVMPSESATTLARDGQAPEAWAATLRRDAALPAVWQATVLLDGIAPEAVLATLNRDAVLPFEWKGAIAVTIDGAMPMAFRAGLVRDAAAPISTRTQMARDGIAPAALSTSLVIDGRVLEAFGAGLASDGKALVEWVAGLLEDGLIQVEWNGVTFVVQPNPARTISGPGRVRVLAGSGRVRVLAGPGRVRVIRKV